CLAWPGSSAWRRRSAAVPSATEHAAGASGPALGTARPRQSIRTPGTALAGTHHRRTERPGPGRAASGAGAMRPPEPLQHALSESLGDARLVAETLPGTDIALWLIDASNMERAFNPEE